MRGGLPPSFTAADDEAGFLWLEQYVATFLDRDIPQLGISIPAATLRRFWTMICHYHGQILNHSELARSFGISDMTVRRYLDILEGNSFFHRQDGNRLEISGCQRERCHHTFFTDPQTVSLEWLQKESLFDRIDQARKLRDSSMKKLLQPATH